MSIYAKMLAIQQEITEVPKTGYNESQRYEFRTIDDVLVTVRNALNKHGVACYPTRQEVHSHETNEEPGKRGPRITTRVVIGVTYCFADAETGEMVFVESVGEGIDYSGDKATYKALTGAQKYALTQAFSIPCDGYDPESFDEPELAPVPGGRR